MQHSKLSPIQNLTIIVSVLVTKEMYCRGTIESMISEELILSLARIQTFGLSNYCHSFETLTSADCPN